MRTIEWLDQITIVLYETTFYERMIDIFVAMHVTPVLDHGRYLKIDRSLFWKDFAT